MTPLRDELESAGARFPTSGGAAPDDFGSSHDEYAAARDAAALADRSSITRIELRGRDRVKFLHNLCTNDIKALAPGDGCEAFLTSAQGKVLAFVRVFAGAETIWIDTVPGCGDSLIKHLDRYLILEKVELVDRTADWCQLLVVGPRAADVISAAGLTRPTPAEGLRVVETTLDGGPCQLISSDTLGIPSYELRVPAGDALRVWRRVRAAGEPIGLRLIGERGLDVIRIEAGLPAYGVDIDESNLPQEVGRDRRAISFTKGCYIGQETVARIDAMGHVNRHLVGLKVASREPPPRRATIQVAGKPTGHITSSAYSPSLDSAIALGYVRRGHERPGAEVVIDLSGTPIPAAVHVLPFLQ